MTFLRLMAIGLLLSLTSCLENQAPDETSATELVPVNTESALSVEDAALFQYSIADTALYDIIVGMDRAFFDAYNNCDLETQANLFSEDLEFYHDLGGLEKSKSVIMEALEENICGKVTRHLVPGSIEVYPIPGFGAAQIGLHFFSNLQEPDAPRNPSRFVVLWKLEGDQYRLTRVLSLH